MNRHIVSVILNNLHQDLLHFLVFALITGIVLILWIAGAKLLEMKEMERWPSLFAIIPLFWLITAVFDPRPEKARHLTQGFSLIFGIVSIGFVILLFKIF